MRDGDQFNVKIEKLASNGFGIAKINGKIIFVENSCPEDFVKIKIKKSNKNFSVATIIEIIEPSKYRISPKCPMQKVCGACQIQFIDYNYQLEIKRQIVADTFHTIAGIDIDIPLTIASPKIFEYRHKIQYPVTETKDSKRILSGYYKPQTHELVNIKYCPIQPEICDRIIDFIRENAGFYGIRGYNEGKHTGDLRHVVIRVSEFDKKCLVILVINSNYISQGIKDFAKNIYDKFKNIVGVCVNFNPNNTNVIFGKNTQCIVGQDYIEEKILDKTFLIGPQTFFQINPKSAENIFKYVKNYISQNFYDPLVLDAYAGISAFGICVSDISKKVVSIEENLSSVELAKITAKSNNVNNIEIYGGDAGEFFENEKRKFDAIILDPPRKGCSIKSLDETLRLCKDTIIYISCNPATLARDIKYLIQKGCSLKSVQPFDMFCHTYHVENVAIIKLETH